MNNYFVDTSALFKRYIPEQGTGRLDDIFEQDAAIYISDVTIIEVISNLKRKNEITKELENSAYKKIKSEFFNDIAQGKIKTSGVISSITIEAVNLLDKNYLTPMDSIQLATALQLNADKGNAVFICSDKKLGRLAEKYGLKFLQI